MVEQNVPEGTVKEKKKRKTKQALRSKTKIYRVTVSPRQNNAGKNIEEARILEIRGKDINIIVANEEESSFFTIIGMDDTNVYSNDSFYVRECVDLASLVSERSIQEAGQSKLVPKMNLVPLDKGKKEE